MGGENRQAKTTIRLNSATVVDYARARTKRHDKLIERNRCGTPGQETPAAGRFAADRQQESGQANARESCKTRRGTTEPSGTDRERRPAKAPETEDLLPSHETIRPSGSKGWACTK
jgi:hypothetical protein